MRVTRFAPSTTGAPHLGTLLSAFFAAAHARASGAQLRLRLEDLDPERCRPEYAKALIDTLGQFEFEWDAIDIQSDNRATYQVMLDELAGQDLIYACTCSRSRLKNLGQQAPDGSFAYDGHCRKNIWKSGDSHENLSLRIHLTDIEHTFSDLRFGTQSFNVVKTFGDPIVMRRDGAFSYHFSSIIDDQNTGVTDVVRGRDLLYASPVQVALRADLGLPVPNYIHHPLLMERRGKKLAKLHGSLPVQSVLAKHSPQDILGKLGMWFGLRTTDQAVSLKALIEGFEWAKVASHDLVVELADEGLSATIHQRSE